jgi:tetratricopeptide (TPR) repeat protein
LGRHEEGLELFKGLLTDGVVNPEILGNYFGALAESGRTEELREAAKPYLDSEYSELATIWTAVSWRNEGDPEAAWKVIEPDLGSLLEDPETTIFVIDVTLQRGEYADALTYAEEALANTGNKDFEFHRGIALLNLGQFAGAREAFEATLAANPGHADARSLLSQVINLLGQNDPSLYNSPIEAVALCPEIEAYKGKASEEYLAQTGALTHRIGEAVSWEPGKPLRVTRYSRVTVRDRDALARLKERVIPFDPLAQRVYVNQLDVFDADGKLVAEGNPSQYYLSDPQEDSVIDTRKSLHLPIPGLLVGGSYELAFTIEYQGGTDILYFTEYCFSNLYPREVSFFQFTGALDRVAVHTNSPSIHALDAEDALLWVADEPPVFENHAFLPLYSEYMPMIRIADAKDASWQKLAHTYAEELAPVMGETPENIATEAAALNIGDGSPEAIVKAVSDLLSERYTYTALNFGRHATQPHDPAEICQNRFGDCKDFTVAMHHYLKALGIDSVPALVRSGRGLVEELPSMDQFDHMVLYVPVLGENPLVDPSDGHMAIGQTPRSVLGEPILPISADSEGLLPPAGFSSADNNVTVDRTLVLQEDGTIKGEETAEFSGYIAAYLRDVLTPLDPEDHLQSVEDLFMGSGLNLDILSFESPNLHEMNETLQVHLRYQKERALFEAERDLIGQLTPSWDYLFFRHQRNERDRTQPVEVYHPASIANQTTVSWPASMHLASSLEELNGETVTPFGTLDFKLTPGAPHEFRYAANATLRHGTYEAAAYLPLTEYFEKVRRSLTPTVRLQMPEATKD